MIGESREKNGFVSGMRAPHLNQGLALCFCHLMVASLATRKAMASGHTFPENRIHARNVNEMYLVNFAQRLAVLQSEPPTVRVRSVNIARRQLRMEKECYFYCYAPS